MVRILATLVVGLAPCWANGLAAQTTPATPPAPCTSAERKQLDFWVGKWDVYPTGGQKLVAHSLIEKLYDGCAIRENWMPLKGTDGGSLSAYDPKTRKWHQTWVDASGATVKFDGGWDGSKMVIDGMWADVLGPGKDAIVRMSYWRQADGSVRQVGVTTVDAGKTWQPSFDFTYKPAAS
ncbi:hypothetical protein FPZ24_15540 [Sphingomonas panacisoli]|uniref:DUF1579 domain-containing protein n=1 Tax=Sphingomonas panacisoli TaxID=1813879 RepID=A0A5B8LM20_9SPHN|nr:hypothetical protein [Sphingomonas panacisoli]QDZ08705.1 hypothetical protein FPZ24_15540 [Sphingomonas panacisoli]